MGTRISRVGRCGIAAALTGVLLFSLPLTTEAQTGVRSAGVVASPLRPVEMQAGKAVTRLSLDAAAYREVESLDHVVLTDFVLGPDQRVDLELSRVEVFADDARVVLAMPQGDVRLPRPDVVLLSGQVGGQPNSLVFLSLAPSGTNGLIELGNETFVISSGVEQRGGNAGIYNLTTLPPEAIKWREWTCGTDLLPVPEGAGVLGAIAEAADSYGGASQASFAARRAVVAVETDWEFTGSLFGGNEAAASAYVATLLGAASEIYMRDVDTELQIGFLRLWSDSGDPWTGSSTSEQLTQFRNYWNSNMRHVERHVVHFLSGRSLGGGIAYLPGLCSTNWDYGLSANLGGYFPYPLQDNHGQNWDIFVVAHEMGHNFNAPHTHSMSPRIDNCAGGDCSVTPNGTIMSYCHLCSGGMSNIVLNFHDRIINERILPYLNFSVSCDLTGDPTSCGGVLPPLPGPLGTANRYLPVVGRNAGRQTAIRITPSGLAPPYDVLNDIPMWVGEPELLSENAGAVTPEDPPTFPTFWGATLVCDENNAHVTDWSAYDTVHVYHAGIVPGALYVVQAIDDTCDSSVEANFSFPLAIGTSRWGDVVKDCSTDPCGPADGLVNVVTDAVAVLDKFQNLDGAPIKARCDLEPALPDRKVNITDLNFVIDAFRGSVYSLTVPPPCP